MHGEDRQSQQRQGSDAMTSSRARSSISAGFDDNMSDEDLENENDPSECNTDGVNVTMIQGILEKDHDGKGLSANITD